MHNPQRFSLVYYNNKGCLRRDECFSRLFFANAIIYMVRLLAANCLLGSRQLGARSEPAKARAN